MIHVSQDNRWMGGLKTDSQDIDIHARFAFVYKRLIRSLISKDDVHQYAISMNNAHRGLRLTRFHIEQIFPKLTPAQIRRITARGQMRTIKNGESLYEQGETTVPFFVIISGELEIVRPLGTAAIETLVAVLGSGQFTGEVSTLSGRRTLFRLRASKPGKVIELDRQRMLALVQNDAELG